MITFNEIQTPGYPARTAYNIKNSDLTIAIAVDFNTAGEQLTKKLCKQYSRPYLPIMLTDEVPSGERWDIIADFIYKVPRPKNGRIINIAGNGIYSLPKGQEYYNNWLCDFFGLTEWCLCIDKVISGGQTGIDEAGIIGAHRLGYDCEINAPKHWMFKTKTGTICDETLFKSRFMTHTNQPLRPDGISTL